eukprot:NODE_1_length_95616_cov_0.657642.p7 type:complete len:550 gc:universal NODE_1_length_95616_cov_0.657642:80876-79227(-)
MSQMSSSNSTVCPICSHPFLYNARMSCDHEMCSVCALRMFLLFKSTDCVYCKKPISYIIIGSKGSTSDLNVYPYAHQKWQIYYKSNDAYFHVMNLLGFSCPVPGCTKKWNTYLYFTPAVRNKPITGGIIEHVKYTKQTYAAFEELKNHLTQHDNIKNGYKYCEICIRESKKFISELNIYPSDLLASHIKTGDKLFLQSTVNNSDEITVDITHSNNVVNPLINFTGHPLCKFCSQRFVNDEYLKHHMKQRHEECSLCKQSGKSLWFKNLNELKKHYKEDHIACEYCINTDGLLGFATELDYLSHLSASHAINSKLRIGQLTKPTSHFQDHSTSDSTTYQRAPRLNRSNSECLCSQNIDLKVLCAVFHHDERCAMFQSFLVKQSHLNAQSVYEELLRLQPRLFTYPDVSALIKWLICTSPVQFRNQLKNEWKPFYESNCKFPDLNVADCVSRYTVNNNIPKMKDKKPRSMLTMVNRGDKIVEVGNPIYLPWLWTDVPLPVKKEEAVAETVPPRRTIQLSALSDSTASEDNTNNSSKKKKGGRKKEILMKLG